MKWKKFRIWNLHYCKFRNFFWIMSLGVIKKRYATTMAAYLFSCYANCLWQYYNPNFFLKVSDKACLLIIKSMVL